MNQDEINFWRDVEALIKPIAVTDIEYRLHYNNTGTITMCSMSNHPESAQYLVVDRETYNNYFRYTVVDGALVKIKTDAKYTRKLMPANSGIQVVQGHAGLIIEDSETHTEIEHYEFRSN
jgi:hypothetical protein